MADSVAFLDLIEKFNPYHDSRGRFAASSGAASMTFRTDYGPGQKAIANLKEKGMAGAAAAKPEKKTKTEKPTKKPAEKPEKKPAEQAAGGDKPVTYTAQDKGYAPVTMHATEDTKAIIDGYGKQQKIYDHESFNETVTRLDKSQNDQNWKLTPDERVTVYSYTGDGHRAINSVNRTGKVNGKSTGFEVTDAKADSKLIEKAINKTGLGENMVLYRGAGTAALKNIGINKSTDLDKVDWGSFVGKTYKDKSFTSTSANKDGAFTHKPVSIRYYTPKGAKAASVAHISIYKQECEVLINKGVEFKVLSIGATKGHVMMDVLVSPGK